MVAFKSVSGRDAVSALIKGMSSTFEASSAASRGPYSASNWKTLNAKLCSLRGDRAKAIIFDAERELDGDFEQDFLVLIQQGKKRLARLASKQKPTNSPIRCHEHGDHVIERDAKRTVRAFPPSAPR